MNKCVIIGNLTRSPELRTTGSGTNVCNFTVAVNRRRGEQETTDYFRVTAWRQLGENCAQYLEKGRKVAVIGTVAARAYTGSDGAVYATMELTADEVEFLTPRSSGQGCTQVSNDELPEEFR